MSVKRNRGEDLVSTVECWSYTHIKVIRVKYTWTIRNFSFCCEDVGQSLKSPIFPIDDNRIFKCNIMMFPKGENHDYREYVGLYVQIDPMSETTVNMKLKLSILHTQGVETHSVFEPDVLLSKNSRDNPSKIIWGYPDFVSRQFLFIGENGVLPDDTLTVFCEVAASSGYETLSHQITISKPTLVDDMQRLFENSELSDVTFSVNGRDFKLHKAILSARSPVFRAMFELDMIENQNNRVEITDFDEEVLGEFLRFVYTGRVSNLENLAEDLFKAADKYGLTSLKVMCEAELGNNLSINNAVKIFTLADLYNSDHLKKQSKKFILMNIIEVINTRDWNIMIEEYPGLAADALKFE